MRNSTASPSESIVDGFEESGGSGAIGDAVVHSAASRPLRRIKTAMRKD